MTEQQGFYTRLAKAQAEFTNAVLDESNEYDRYKYASYGSLIAAARPALNAANIAVLHSIESAHELPNLLLKGKGPNVAVRTVLQADDGLYDAGVVSVPVRGRSLKGGGEGPVDAQAYGSAITYAKRYGLELALGIGREDEHSVDQQPQRQAAAPPPPQQRQNRPQAQQARPTATFGADTDLDTVKLENVGQLMELANKVFERPIASVLHALNVSAPAEISDPNEALRQLRTLWGGNGDGGSSGTQGQGDTSE